MKIINKDSDLSIYDQKKDNDFSTCKKTRPDLKVQTQNLICLSNCHCTKKKIISCTKKITINVQRSSIHFLEMNPSVHSFIHSLIPIDPNVCWHENLPHVINEKWHFFPLFISLYKKNDGNFFSSPLLQNSDNYAFKKNCQSKNDWSSLEKYSCHHHHHHHHFIMSNPFFFLHSYLISRWNLIIIIIIIICNRCNYYNHRW